MNDIIRSTPYSKTSFEKISDPTRAQVESFSARLHMILDFQQEYYNTPQRARQLVEEMAEQNTNFILHIIFSDSGERTQQIYAFGGKNKLNITQYEILAIILEQLRILVGIPHITLVDIASVIRPLLQSGYFGQAEQDDIFIGLERYFQDYKKTEANFMEYDGVEGEKSMKLLHKLTSRFMHNPFQYYQLKGNVRTRIYRGSIIFFFENTDDYKYLCGEHRQGSFISGARYFTEPVSDEFTFGNAIFINGWVSDEKVIIHEVAHRKTVYTDEFVTKTQYDGIEDIFGTARDEILSYLEEDMSCDQLKSILLDYTGGYNPIPNRRPKGRKKKREVWQYYAKRLDRFIDDAYEVKSLYPNLYIYLLSSTSISFWRFLASQKK